MVELVSIIMPSYKSGKYISESIDSVLLQTYIDWELIIVDDASPDNSCETIKKYINRDSRIRLISLSVNSGPALARNIGIENATGRFIAFLDSDDRWLPTKLEKQLEFLKRNNLSLTYSSYYTMDDQGYRINVRRARSTISYNDMLKSNHIGNLTGIYDVSRIGKYFMDETGHEDYTLWLKIMRDVGQTMGIVEPLAEYRVMRNSISANKIKTLMWQWNIYRTVAGLGLLRSAYYIIWYIYYGLRKRV